MGEIEEVLDSNIVIDVLGNRPEALPLLRSTARQGISIVTWIEVLAGAKPWNEAAYQLFLGRFTILEITPTIALESVRLRQTTRLKLPDAIILATARVHQCPLLTRNTRDFPAGTPGVRIPYTLQP